MENTGDIKEWLRRRQGNDLVMMGGKLAGEIADHIATLEAAVVANQKDAERYRWLRHGDNDEEVLIPYAAGITINGCSMFLYRNEKLDSLIDKFINEEDSV
jgi:hypothetical protein